MILINLHTVQRRFADCNLPALFHIARRDSGKDQDARPYDAHRPTAAAREPFARRLDDATPPLLALTIWEVAEQERPKG